MNQEKKTRIRVIWYRKTNYYEDCTECYKSTKMRMKFQVMLKKPQKPDVIPLCPQCYAKEKLTLYMIV